MIKKIFRNIIKRDQIKSNNFNIWIINQFANTPDLPGHTRQYEIAKYLSANGWKVSVFSSDFNLSKRKFTKLNNFQLIKKTRIEKIRWNWLRVTSYKFNNWKRYLNLLSFCLNLVFNLGLELSINKIKSNAKGIIFASSPQLPAAFFAFVMAKLFKHNFVLEIRDLWPQVLIDNNNGSENSFIIKILQIIESTLYKYSDSVVVLSIGVKRYLKKRGVENVKFLPNGPDLREFKFSPLPIEEKNFTYSRPFKIMYFGSHGEANDLINVVKAAQIVKNLHINFIFVGDGIEKNNLIKECSKLNNIFFEDPIKKSLMPSKISTADAVIISLKDIPLFKYGVSPNKLYDAYAIGRPVISSVGGYINEEIEKNNLGTTSPPGNPKALADAIYKLYKKSRKERELMGIRARKLSEEIYSREKICKDFNMFLKNNICK